MSFLFLNILFIYSMLDIHYFLKYTINNFFTIVHDVILDGRVVFPFIFWPGTNIYTLFFTFAKIEY